MRYINPKMLEDSLIELKNTPYFVDKTGLIVEATKSIRTMNKYLCVTRPRRFGKTTNVQTLGAFLAKDLDVEELFEDLEVTASHEAMRHMGAHDVIYIDFSTQTDGEKSYAKYLDNIGRGIVEDLQEMFSDTVSEKMGPLEALATVYNKKQARFCFVMDEWDSIFYDDKFSKQDGVEFLKFLKQLLKDKPYVEFAYMTGVMPIAKHSSGSELNMFKEYTSISDPRFENYFGFSEAEVKELLVRHKKSWQNPELDYEALKYWYDGYYRMDGSCCFNPRSVVLALEDDFAKSYWTSSGPTNEVLDLIEYNIADVRDDVARMTSGEPVKAKVNEYSATSQELKTREEIFSAMVVFGMLTYYNGYVSVPNYELMLKFQEALQNEDMGYIAKLVKRSEQTLRATIEKDAETVAQIVEASHDQEIPLLRYKNEADLAALINLVYLSARDNYHIEREKAAGKGVADVAFTPISPTDPNYLPFIVELKVADNNETAENAAERAIEQIKSRNYLAMFKDALTGESKFDAQPLAVAISWDPKNKKHSCRIENLA